MDDKFILVVIKPITNLIGKVGIKDNITRRACHQLGLGIASDDPVKDIKESIFFANRHYTTIISTKIQTSSKNYKY
jgi:hypothetical protein